MRILIALVGIGLIALVVIISWHYRITRFNGHYKFYVYAVNDKSNVVGSGEVVILSKLGGFNFVKRWPYLEHYNEVSGCKGEIKLSDGLLDELNGVILIDNIGMRITSGNYYDNGIFQYRVGKPIHNNKSVILNIDVGGKCGQLFLWSSPYTEGKQLGAIYELGESD